MGRRGKDVDERMGCDKYWLGNAQWVSISEDSQESCLCTWPFIDEEETLYVDRLRSLAMIGALVVLRHQGLALQSKNITDYYLPEALPKWFMLELDRLLPKDEQT